MQMPFGVLGGREVETETSLSSRAFEPLVLDGHRRALENAIAQNAAAQKACERRQTEGSKDRPAYALDDPRASLEHHVLLHGILPACEFIHRLLLGPHNRSGSYLRTVTCKGSSSAVLVH